MENRITHKNDQMHKKREKMKPITDICINTENKKTSDYKWKMILVKFTNNSISSLLNGKD